MINSLMKSSKRTMINYSKLLALQIARTLLLFPFVLGFLAGWIVLVARYTWAAIITGYETGNKLW